jgi:hypothetical protein
VTTTQILAIGLAHLCTPGPQSGWPYRIQDDLDRRDAAHRDMTAAEYGSDTWRDAQIRRIGAECRLATALHVPPRETEPIDDDYLADLLTALNAA